MELAWRIRRISNAPGQFPKPCTRCCYCLVALFLFSEFDNRSLCRSQDTITTRHHRRRENCAACHSGWSWMWAVMCCSPFSLVREHTPNTRWVCVAQPQTLHGRHVESGKWSGTMFVLLDRLNVGIQTLMSGRKVVALLPLFSLHISAHLVNMGKASRFGTTTSSTRQSLDIVSVIRGLCTRSRTHKHRLSLCKKLASHTPLCLDAESKVKQRMSGGADVNWKGSCRQDRRR